MFLFLIPAPKQPTSLWFNDEFQIFHFNNHFNQFNSQLSILNFIKFKSFPSHLCLHHLSPLESVSNFYINQSHTTHPLLNPFFLSTPHICFAALRSSLSTHTHTHSSHTQQQWIFCFSVSPLSFLLLPISINKSLPTSLALAHTHRTTPSSKSHSNLDHMRANTHLSSRSLYTSPLWRRAVWRRRRPTDTSPRPIRPVAHQHLAVIAIGIKARVVTTPDQSISQSSSTFVRCTRRTRGSACPALDRRRRESRAQTLPLPPVGARAMRHSNVSLFDRAERHCRRRCVFNHRHRKEWVCDGTLTMMTTIANHHLDERRVCSWRFSSFFHSSALRERARPHRPLVGASQ